MAELKIETVEQQIARHVVNCLIEYGYRVAVYNGEEEVCPPSTEADKILHSLSTTDIDCINTTSGGWVRLVWGNGRDLISDYTTDLELALKPVLDAVDKLQ